MSKRFNKVQREKVINWVSLGEKADDAKAGLIDMLHSDGYLWTDFVSPKSEGSTCESQEVFDSWKEAVVMGFTKKRQTVYFADSKSLDDDQLDLRAVVQRRAGARMGQLSSGLKKRQVDESEAGQILKLADKCLKSNNAMLTKLEKADPNEVGIDFNVTEAIKVCKLLNDVLQNKQLKIDF
tara:strand:+ start:149 stop:691 length:543 start_codon:yes stop_codon:yes gene_type:complete